DFYLGNPTYLFLGKDVEQSKSLLSQTLDNNLHRLHHQVEDN
ncbi:hypothetical protein PCS125219_02317, partial [Streptococcus pneumoniae PCS125219]